MEARDVYKNNVSKVRGARLNVPSPSSCWLSSLQSRQHRPPAETPEAPNGMASMPISHRVRVQATPDAPGYSPGLCPLTIPIIPLRSHRRTAGLIKTAPVPRILRHHSHCDARIRTSPLPCHCLNPGIVLLPSCCAISSPITVGAPCSSVWLVRWKGSYTRVSESGRCLRRSHPAVLWRTVPLVSLL